MGNSTILNKFNRRKSVLETMDGLSRQRDVIRTLKALEPRSEEDEKKIMVRNRILAACMVSTSFSTSSTPFISPTSEVIQFIQIGNPLRKREGVYINGSRWHNLADVRVRVAKHTLNDEGVAIIDPNGGFERLAFSVQLTETYNDPDWAITHKPRPVKDDYAKLTGLWVPRSPDTVKDMAAAEPDFTKRKRIQASIWEPYKSIVGKLVTIVREMFTYKGIEVYLQYGLARTVEEEDKLLTPIFGLDGDKILEEEVYPNLEEMSKEYDSEEARLTAVLTNTSDSDLNSDYDE